MRILVTGATGFLGAALCRTLSARGHEIIAPGRSDTGLYEYQSWSLGQELNLNNIDIIVHTAAYLPKSYADSSEATRCLTDNSIATLKILEQASAANIKLFVYVSSGNIYDCAYDVASEGSNIYPSMRAPYYLVSKAVADVFADHVRRTSQMAVSIIRPSYIYGPGMKSFGLVPRLTLKLQQDQTLTFKDIGNYRIDLVHVDDVVKAIVQVIIKNVSDTFNVGGTSVSTLFVAQTLASLLNKTHLVTDTQQNITDFSHAALDISKAKQILNYSPCNLRDGLQSYVSAL